MRSVKAFYPHQAFTLYWSLVIFLLPVYYRSILVMSPSGRIYTVDSRSVKDFFFLFACLGSLAIFPTKPRRSLPLISLVFLVCYGIVSTGVLTSGAQYLQTFSILIGLAALGQLDSMWEDCHKKVWRNVLAVSCICQALWVVLQDHGIEMAGIMTGRFVVARFLVDGHFPRAGALFNNMLSGPAIACLIPFLWRKYWVLAVPVALYAVYLTTSAMGALAAFVAVNWMMWRTLRPWPWGRAIYMGLWPWVGLFLYAHFPLFFLDSGRLAAWKETIEWIGFTLWGHGPGYFRDHGPRHIKAIVNLAHPHNEFLAAYTAWGVVGCWIILGYLRFAFRRANVSWDFAACLAGLLAAGVGGFPFYTSTTAMYLIITLVVLFNGGENYAFGDQC